jgi:hypothetical protein
MKMHHIIAVTAAALNVGALTVDTIVYARTGHRTFVTDDAEASAVGAGLMSLWLGATFAALALVLHREAGRFGTASRLARGARVPLLGGLVTLAVGFVVLNAPTRATGTERGVLYDLSGLVAMIALGTTFLSALVLGLAVLRDNPLGWGGRVLGAVGPVILLTALLALVAPDFATPIYGSAVVLVGISLVGVRASDVQPATRAAIASPTSAV